MSTKRTHRTVLFPALSIVLAAISLRSTPLHAADAQRAAPVFDGREILKTYIEEKVGEPNEIKRTPLFDNLPFLKLKTGDKLIKAKRWMRGGKGVKPHFDEDESYFLLSNGKYHPMQSGVKEQGKKLILELGLYSLLFDWEVTLANATRLHKNYNPSLTLKSFPNLKNALRKDFSQTLRDVGKVQISAPHLEGASKTRRAIFQGLGFDEYRNTVYKYHCEIGNDTYVEYRKNLIVGPRRVEREEFEGLHGGYINGPMPYKPDPKIAAKARAEFKRMEKFQAIVNKFLVKPHTNAAGFQ